MYLIEVISSLKSIEELNLVEEYFGLSEEEKTAASNRRLELLYRNLDDNLEAQKEGIPHDLCDNWSAKERREFYMDWNNNAFVDLLPPTPVQDEEIPAPDSPQPGPSQSGGAKRASDDNGETSKRAKLTEYFTVKTAKTVRVKKFKTQGI